MAKKTMFLIITFITMVRLADLLFLFFKENSSLPSAAFTATSVMAMLGTLIIVKKLISGVGLKLMIAFFIIDTAVVVFNLAYVPGATPLKLDFFEIIAVGTYLNILVNIFAAYYGIKAVSRNSNIIRINARD